MKRIFFSLFLFALIQSVCAEYLIDNIYYWDSTVGDKTVKVTGIKNADSIGSIVIPATVDIYGQTYTVAEIGYEALDLCKGITSITLPNSLSWIGNRAFWGCSGLTSVTIPKSVTIIGYDAFNRCNNLKEFIVDNNNLNYTSIDGVLFYKDGTRLVSYPNSKSDSYFVPNGVKSIGKYAFENCTNITSIVLPSSLTSIDTYAFSGCNKLTSINLPNNITYIGSGAFMYCNGLNSITLPSSLTTIDNWAFGYCSGMTSLILPDNLITIGSFAFDSCTGLSFISIPKSLSNIGDYRFTNCMILPENRT